MNDKNGQTNIEQDAAKLYAAVQTEMVEDEKQVEVLTKRIDKRKKLLNALRGSIEDSNGDAKTGYGSQRDAILQAINQIPEAKFTQDDVEAVLLRAEPTKALNRSRIRSALWVLADRQEKIKTVRKGNNTQPAQFEKVAVVTTNGKNNLSLSDPLE